MTIQAKICVYDGELPCKLVFAGIEIQLGISALKSIIDCANMDLREASGPTQRMLNKPLFVLQRTLELITSLEKPPSKEDSETNRERWEKTGVGGQTDLVNLESRIECWEKEFKTNHFGSMEDFNKTRNKFQGQF